MNGINQAFPGYPSYGFYVYNEVVNGDFVDGHFPDDSNGNIYRGIRNDYWGANLAFLGTNPSPYRINYFKENNQSADDWGDLIGLTRAFDTETNDAYANGIRQVIDVQDWMRYFALETLVDNKETSLGNGHNGLGAGDDYFLYRGVKDPRFVVIPYDFDTIIGLGDAAGNTHDGLFRAGANPLIDRFLKHPEFIPIYYQELKQLCETTFARDHFHALVEQTLQNLVEPDVKAFTEQFMAERTAFVLSQIPILFSAEVSLPVTSGYYYTTNSVCAVAGTANAISSRMVLVNGVVAQWSAWEGTWIATNIALNPGTNSLHIQALDSFQNVVAQTNIFVWKVTADQILLGQLISNVGPSGTPQMTINWSAVSGQVYRIQFKTNLNQLLWSDLSGDVLANSQSMSQTVVLSTNQPQCFYRVIRVN